MRDEPLDELHSRVQDQRNSKMKQSYWSRVKFGHESLDFNKYAKMNDVYKASNTLLLHNVRIVS